MAATDRLADFFARPTQFVGDVEPLREKRQRLRKERGRDEKDPKRWETRLLGTAAFLAVSVIAWYLGIIVMSLKHPSVPITLVMAVALLLLDRYEGPTQRPEDTDQQAADADGRTRLRDRAGRLFKQLAHSVGRHAQSLGYRARRLLGTDHDWIWIGFAAIAAALLFEWFAGFSSAYQGFGLCLVLAVAVLIRRSLAIAGPILLAAFLALIAREVADTALDLASLFQMWALFGVALAAFFAFIAFRVWRAVEDRGVNWDKLALWFMVAAVLWWVILPNPQQMWAENLWRSVHPDDMAWIGRLLRELSWLLTTLTYLGILAFLAMNIPEVPESQENAPGGSTDDVEPAELAPMPEPHDEGSIEGIPPSQLSDEELQARAEMSDIVIGR